jgi:hypothetical protein
MSNVATGDFLTRTVDTSSHHGEAPSDRPVGWKAPYVRYVSIETAGDGYWIDPSAYLEQLPRFAESLPAGARAFATDPEHYDFPGRRFVKNLKPQRLTFGRSAGMDGLELRLRHNCWRHEEDLTIRYHGVLDLTLDPAPVGLDVTGLREVLLDEVLPHEHGCSHEIACTGGSFHVICQDLAATWSYADCAERRA